MTTQKHRSKSFRKVFKKVPGGVVHMQYLHRKPKQAACTLCGRPLAGVPRLRQRQAQTTAKTKKRPERPYGGVLCSSCMRKKIIEQAQKAWGAENT